MGERGFNGERGPVGDQGLKGERGPMGEKGDRGPVGDRGIMGDRGPAGDIGPIGPTGVTGPTGIPGKDGDRFCTKTLTKMLLEPNERSLLIFQVETGLAYIGGNSVIVAEVADKISSELNTFEGTIHYYNPQSGQLILQNIVNIHGDFGIKEAFYHINLDGVDGAPGEAGEMGPTGQPGIMGPTGPSSISSTTTYLSLVDNTIIIQKQDTPITYYSLKLQNNDEIKNIECNLITNQMAIILITLTDLEKNAISTIYTVPNINTNYNTNIVLNNEIKYAILTMYNIENLIFGEVSTYYKN